PLSVCAAIVARSGEKEKSPANHFIPQFQIDTECANFSGQSARGQIPWRRHFQNCHAHRHTDGTRSSARFHYQKPRGCSTCSDGHRKTWRYFTCPAGACRLGPDLRIGRCGDRRRRPNVGGTTPRVGLRSVKLVNRSSLFTLDTCPLLDTHKVQMTKHVLIHNFTQAITRDAASGSGAVSARAAAALHFRVAVSQDARARASTASHVLRGADYADLPGLECA